MRPSFTLIRVLAFVAASLAPGAAAETVPLDYKAYDGWNRIEGTTLSNDGEEH